MNHPRAVGSSVYTATEPAAGGRRLSAFSFLLAMLLKTATAEAAPALRPPPNAAISVAIVVTDGANVIDFAGPWEVFQDTARPGSGEPAFRLFTVSESRHPVRLTGGLTVVPDFAFGDAPTPAVIVVGAQGRSEALLQWLRRIGSAPQTEVLMSVCTGAFKLADAGLLEGKHATTHHDFFDAFARRYPGVTLERGPRFVQSGPHLYTAGGLTSGIDLALHIVAQYYGDVTAEEVARYMEYRAKGRE